LPADALRPRQRSSIMPLLASRGAADIDLQSDIRRPASPIPMNANRPSDVSGGPNWLLRRADQAAVAVLILAGLAATIGWWISRGGWQGRLIEVERAESQVAGFQVNVNEADWPELTQLPGIGPTLARRIIESRQTEGPFRSHDDLLRVRGIGPKTLEQIRPYLRPLPSPASPAGQ